MTEQPPPPAAGGGGGWFHSLVDASKSLTLTNVLVIALLVIVAIPAYAIYTALNDPVLLDRFLSSYHEHPDEDSGCTVRSARVRGGPLRYSVGTGFAMQGRDNWTISVIMPSEPDAEDIKSYCAALDLIVDKMLFER